MNDLRKAAEMALEALEEYTCVVQSGTDPNKWHEVIDGGAPARKAIQALRQALAHEALDEMVAENQRLGLYDDKPPVKTYAGGKPNYCTPVDAVNTSQDRVDETAKGEHEPVAWRNTKTGDFCSGGFLRKDLARWVPLYLAPPKREWVGLTDEAIWLEYQRFWPFHPAEEPTLAKDIAKFARAIEAKLKEKNNG